MNIHDLLSRASHWQRRFLAVLVLVLQAGVAFAPVLDHDGRRPAAHTERRGNRHSAAHNERTCVVCGVRAVQATVVEREVQPPAHAAPRSPAVEYVGMVSTRGPPASNSSRAPPVLS